MPDRIADSGAMASLKGPTLLRARGLTLVTRGETLLDEIDLDIRHRRRTVILGANGAGKSLLLRLLHGLIPPTAGEILWNGFPLDAEARAAQAMVFQRPVLLRRSVLGNIRFALGVRGIRGPERTRLEEEALTQARLSDLAHRPARLLSGGEQQRLALARALVTRPRMLFLDEPTANLDPASTQAVETLVNAAHASGVATVLVTHDAGQARRLGDDLVFMDGGRITETGPTEKVLTSPSSDPARAWLAGQLYVGARRTSDPRTFRMIS